MVEMCHIESNLSRVGKVYRQKKDIRDNKQLINIRKNQERWVETCYPGRVKVEIGNPGRVGTLC